MRDDARTSSSGTAAAASSLFSFRERASVGYGRPRLVLLPVQVEVLDGLRRRPVAVPDRQIVVEVLATGAHAADVEGESRPDEVEQRFGVVADRDRDAGDDLELAEGRVPLGPA